jgi:hypothetical protein
MARDVGEGYILINLSLLKRMTAEELRLLRFELEKMLTGVRGEQPALDNVMALQLRNRKISRLNSAVLMINTQLQAFR